MRFATGLTLSGILGFILYELLKLILPTLATWTLGLLTLAAKIVLGGLVLLVVLGVVALLVFLYRRGERARAEA